uniref:CCHC-type domain-containing protein n=1 Tax=Brassica oleracea var. oleracea TaxID=109376 RepID=A0A0D3BQJ3_BRAOL
MAKKKKPKSHSPGCSPTGSTNSSSLRSSAQSAPASVDLTANKVSSSEVLPPPDNSSLPVSEPKQDQQASDPPRSEPPILDSEPETVESPLKHPLAIECGDTQALSCHEKSPSAMADENNNTVTGQEQMVTLTPPVPETNPPQYEAKLQSTVWRDKVKAGSVNLEPVETPFTLASGETCVRIPNSIIEKNRKSWDSFIIGQFYEDAPARGAVHAIVNGMWSKQRRDISVSKMEGNAFLFRVPCPNTRRRILGQCLWQVEGQTMFVAKWSPGTKPEKPSLSTVPVWLDFTGVPLQFFNQDALKEIAGLVGHPLYVHLSTINLTNIEVAKVYTVIDPRKPLPEAVNDQFESGEVFRILVSCPWLPSLCSHCKKVGHTISKCPSAPPKCPACNSVKHDINSCPKNNADKRSEKRKGKAPIHSQLPIVTGSGNPPARVSSEDLRKKHSSVKKTSSQWVRTNSVMQLPKERINLDPPLGSRRNSKSLPISSQHPLSDQDKDKFCIDLKARPRALHNSDFEQKEETA